MTPRARPLPDSTVSTMASPGFELAMGVACDIAEESARYRNGLSEVLDALDRNEPVDVAAWRERLTSDPVCNYVDADQPWTEPCCAFAHHQGEHVLGVRAAALSRRP